MIEILFDHSGQYSVQRGRQFGIHLGSQGELSAFLGQDHLQQIAGFKRRLAGQTVIEDAAERINVAARIDALASRACSGAA